MDSRFIRRYRFAAIFVVAIVFLVGIFIILRQQLEPIKEMVKEPPAATEEGGPEVEVVVLGPSRTFAVTGEIVSIDKEKNFVILKAFDPSSLSEITHTYKVTEKTFFGVRSQGEAPVPLLIHGWDLLLVPGANATIFSDERASENILVEATLVEVPFQSDMGFPPPSP